MLNRNIKLISVAIMFVSAILLMGGCGMLDLRQAADGTMSTPLTDAINAAGEAGKGIGLFFPAAAGIGSILGLIGSAILGVVVKKKTSTGTKMDSALTAVAAGINSFVYNYDEARQQILAAVSELPIEDKRRGEITAALAKIGSVKDAVSSFATESNIYNFLRLFIKTKEAEGKV